jgi:ATP-binding cassette subfamily B protein
MTSTAAPAAPPAIGILRRTLAMMRPHRNLLVAAVLLGMLSTAASLLQPYLTGKVVGRIVGHHAVLGPFLLLAAVFLAEGVLGASQVYLLGRTGNLVVLDLRRSLVSRLLRAPLAAHQAHRRGDLFATVVADTSIMGSTLAQSLAVLISSAVMVVGSLAFMAYLDLLLTAVIVGCVCVAGFLTMLVTRRLREATRHNRDRVGQFGSALQRAVSDVRTVKVSRAEQREEERIGGFAQRSFAAAMRATRLNALLTPTMGLGVQASFMAVFTVGAYRLSDGSLTTATFSAYLLYLLYLIAPLINFFTGFAQLQQSAASAGRVSSVIDGIGAEDDPAAASHPAPVPVPAPARGGDAPLLRFEGVSFGYEPGQPVLNDLSFEVPSRGQTVLMGLSGSGKSTVFGLIERFWSPESGTVTLGGADIAELPLEQLRRRVGYVEQNAAVLDGTLRENLLYANPDASPTALDEAIDLAGLREWVRDLPQGLETPMGEDGASVSGGQRQRIAIARMLLVDPDLLLLDEATSQLDADAAALLSRTVAKIAERRAVLVIAHQLGAAVAADQVLVLDDGRIRARGTHRELSQSDELYRRLYLTQRDAAPPLQQAPDAAEVPLAADLAATGSVAR